MAVPLLAGLAKGLLSQGAKKAATSALKKAAKDKLKSKAKDFIKNRRKRGKDKEESSFGGGGKKGGALVRALDGGGVSAIVKSSPLKVEEPKLETEGSKIGFEKINIKIENIAKISGSIDDALKGQYQEELERRKRRKAALARLRRRRREKLLEGGKKALDSASGVLSGVGKAFNIMDFIKNILLGGLLLFLLKNFKKIVDALNFVKNNAYILFLSLRAVLQAFRLGGSKVLRFLKSVLKAPVNLIKNGFKGFFRSFGNLLKKGGSVIGDGLRRIGNALFDFGAAAIKRIKDLARAVGSGLKNGIQAAKNIANFLKNTAPLKKLKGALASGGKFLKKSFVTPVANLVKNLSYTKVGNKLVETAFDARLAVKEAGKKVAPALKTSKEVLTAGAARGKELLTAGAQRGRELAGAVKNKVSPFLRKFLGEKTAKEAAGAAPFLKKLKGPLSKIKIPILGPAIELAVNLLDPEVSVGEAIFKSLGAGIGEVLGTFIPIPILGTMLGGILGTYGGSLLYSLLNGGIKAVQKRISADFMKALDFGKKGWEFISGGFKRLIDNFPTVDISKIWMLPRSLGAAAGLLRLNHLKSPNGKVEKLPDLGALFDLGKMGKLLKASFFPDGTTMPSLPPTSISSDAPEEEAQVEPQEKIVGRDDMPTEVTPSSEGTTDLMGAVKNPQETDGNPVSPNPPATGTGLKDIVPTQNLTTIGAGTGPVGKTSERGQRWGRHHAGVDIGTSGQKGWFVAFKLKGQVTDVGTFAGYGKTVIITSGGKDFLFAHLAQTTVKKGQQYNGEIIGEIGNTGAGTGEHLHFEVSPAGTGGYSKDEDPNPYLKYLIIGKMGDGSAMNTETKTAPQIKPTSETIKRPQGSSSPSAPAKRTANLEQYPSYDDSNQNVVVINDNQMPAPSRPSSGGGSKRATMPGASTTDLLNSYYKQQLLGLLYKVG